MDLISDVLSKVNLSSVVYFKSNFSVPWGMEVPKGPFAQFHMLSKGQCILKTNQTSLKLNAGDIVVFPFGESHWLANNEKSQRFQGQEVVESILSNQSLFSGKEHSATLVCGHFQFDMTYDHPFIQELPSMIHITNSDLRRFNWLKNISDLVIEEASKQQSGSEIIVNKLGEILFIHTLRAHIEKSKSKHGFIAAIQDDRIGKVLKEIHHSSHQVWSLDQLAGIAAMSRTSFANRFKSLTGETPFNYITRWRLLKAKELLELSKMSVGEIAEQVGYQSEAAFNRVFKKRVSQTPLKFRQNILVS